MQHINLKSDFSQFKNPFKMVSIEVNFFFSYLWEENDQVRVKNILSKYVALALIGVIGMALFPLSPFFLDQFLCLSIAVSIVLFAGSLYVKDITSLTCYPSLLLYSTVMRIGLNLSSTRLILSKGEGSMLIIALGKFMTSGSILTGVSIFFLIFIVNFILISKGAERTAEIRARFALESLPGSQMSLDAEVLSGKLSPYGAECKREKIRKTSDFYSCMEGAFKFIKGDTLISVIVVFVNFFGLLLFSILSPSSDFSWEKMSFLVLGDGIVGQIPLIFTSMGGATLVSRVGKNRSFVEEIVIQIRDFYDLFKVGGCVVLCLLLIPGVPVFPICLISGLFFYLGFRVREEKNLFSECGKLVISINHDFPCSEKELRVAYLSFCRKVQIVLGLTFPRLTLNYSSNLENGSWGVILCGKQVCRGNSLDKNQFLNSFDYNLYSISDEIISGEYVENLLREVRIENGWLTDELIPRKISRDCLTMVLKFLVRERISLALFPKILEVLTLYSGTLDPEEVTEYVRKQLGVKIGDSVLKGHNVVRVVTFENAVEKMMEVSDKINPRLSERILNEMDLIFRHSSADQGAKDIIVTRASVRYIVKKMIEHRFPDVPVLAYGEIKDTVSLKKLGLVSDAVLVL